MDVLRCHPVAGVQKELLAYAIVYNLVRSVMVEAADRQGVEPDRISFIKRRPGQFPLMKKSRQRWRKDMMAKEIAA